MPTAFDPAPREMYAVLARILKAYHPNIVETGANIGIVVGRNPDGPAVKYHGTAVLGMIQVVSAKRRPNCEYDAEIIIDGGEWDQLLPTQQDALVDHELCHLRRKEYSEKRLKKLRKENPDHPAWKVDNLGRPMLGTIPADMTPGDGFACCIERHGSAAIEFVTAERFAEFAKKAMKRREK